jgi:hypothetical protein
MKFGSKLADYLYIPLFLLVVFFFENMIILRDLFRDPRNMFLGNIVFMLLIVGIGLTFAFTYTFRHCSVK